MTAKNSNPKIMDVVHPGKAVQPTTSRPVIVTNRPMIAEDPMIAQTAKLALERKEASVSPTPTFDIAGAPDIHHGKTVSPVKSEPGKPEEVIEPVEPVPAVVDTAPEPPKDFEKHDVAEPSVGATDNDSKEAAEKEESRIDDSLKPADTPPAVSTQDEAAPAAPSEKPVAQFADIKTTIEEVEAPTELKPKDDVTLTTDSEDVADAKAAINDAVAEKRQAELDLLISTGKYRVPIGQHTYRHRARIVAGILAVVLLLVLLLDVLLDAGILTISGVPHTDFFGL